MAAVIVMLYHFCGTDSYLRPYVPHLISRGFLGVDVFFVLSGRVYPLYFLITLIFVAKYGLNLSGVWSDNFHAADFVACLLMVQAWGFGFANVAGATWSLSTEFFAYIRDWPSSA